MQLIFLRNVVRFKDHIVFYFCCLGYLLLIHFLFGKDVLLTIRVYWSVAILVLLIIFCIYTFCILFISFFLRSIFCNNIIYVFFVYIRFIFSYFLSLFGQFIFLFFLFYLFNSLFRCLLHFILNYFV